VLGLEDLLVEVHDARQSGDVGRLALLTFCELRRWARQANRRALAEQADAIFLRTPYADRQSFLEEIDALVCEAEGDLAALRLQHECQMAPQGSTCP
jgi:hypothetical protein